MPKPKYRPRFPTYCRRLSSCSSLRFQIIGLHYYREICEDNVTDLPCFYGLIFSTQTILTPKVDVNEAFLVDMLFLHL